jgi:acetyltransferase-like isoleucine patch superfamily enzyme
MLECRKAGFIKIGAGSGLSFPVISSRSGITIGSHVKLGGNVRIFDHDYHALDLETRRSPDDSDAALTRPVVIEDDVFIGANSMVLKGVRVGQGSVVGAGSVVSKSIPAGEIWAGNPARLIRKIQGESL